MSINRRLLTLEKNQPDRLEKVMRRLSKLTGSQRQDYLDSLPDSVLEEFLYQQSGIPRGKLCDGMLEAIAKGEAWATIKKSQ